MDTEQLESKLSRRLHTPLFARLASEYLSSSRITEARNLCIAGIEKYPSYSTPYLLLAKCYETENNLPSALESIQHAKALNPNSQVICEYYSKIENYLSDSSAKYTELQNPELTETIGSGEFNQKSEAIVQDQSEIESNPQDLSPVEEMPLSVQENQIFLLQDDLLVDGIAKTSEEEDVPATDVDTRNEPTLINEQAADFLGEGTNIITPEPILAMNDLVVIPEENTEVIDTAPDKQDETVETESGESIIISEESAEPVIQEAAEIPDQIEDKSEINQPSLDVEQVSLRQSDINEHQYIEQQDEQPLTSTPDQESDVSIQELPISYEESVTSPVKQDEFLNSANIDTPPPLDTHDDDGRIVSKTLAEIYAAQGEYNEAIITYQLLKQLHPQNSEKIDARIGELENKAGNKSEG
jgi:tetratricopeptide (TPR) repeat protein